jgi:hypothetical protein
MRRSFVRLLVLGLVLFFAGWGLMLVSRYGGNSVGGSELLWRVGGVMVYASVPTLLLTALLGLLALIRSAAGWHGHRA